MAIMGPARRWRGFRMGYENLYSVTALALVNDMAQFSLNNVHKSDLNTLSHSKTNSPL